MKKIFGKKQLEQVILSRAYSFDDMLGIVSSGSSYEVVYDRKNEVYILVDLYDGFERMTPDDEELALRNLIKQNPERFSVFPQTIEQPDVLPYHYVVAEPDIGTRFKEWAKEHKTEK